ncbi:4Fe-4S binding protein, partial [Parabacteroides goldsteinii]
GRIANNLFQPLWMWGNNLFAYLAARVESYAFYEVDVWMKSLPTFLAALATLVVLVVLAWRNGRTYCNTICPVGTVLGFISRYSLYRVTIDTDKCNSCGLCARQCKAACIDSKEHKIDGSRCVACMNCLDACRKNALTYAPVWKTKKQATGTEKPEPEDKTNLSRRRALSATALVMMGSALKAQEKKGEEVIMKRDGGLAPIKERKKQEKLTAIVPPGALSIRNMRQHCTACQLCISVCPNHVLRPSGGLMTLMQPEMSYERGYCRPECTKCSEVCPAGAIKPITKADKSSVQIGHAVWVKANCIPLTDGVECGNCSRHCPTNAIEMVASDADNPKSLKIPVINTERCIGCGACEHLCPSRPFTAIYVEGHERHRVI